VVFSALEFVQFSRFEAASLTQTSVIIVLPLGTLVAQRLANPAAFGTGPGSEDASHHNHNNHTTNSSSSSTNPRSGLSTATTTKRPLLLSMSSNGGGVHRGVGGGAVVTHIASDGSNSMGSSEKGRVGHYPLRRHEDHLGASPAVDDTELADLERGNGHGGGVRVDYGIERREERVPTGSS
jgi:pheromone alpha factor receptor